MPDIQPETRVQSETVYHGHLIDVHKDTLRLPNGKTTVREVILHPEVVAMLPILDDGRIVFVRQYRYAAGQTLLEIPAGGIDGGETAEQAARREMKEETGYDVGALEHMASFYSSPGFTNELMHLFTVTDLTAGTPTEENDQIEIECLDLEDALQRIGSGEMRDAKTVAALTLYAAQHP
jgi:ADP-ribose pyrophosphatase